VGEGARVGSISSRTSNRLELRKSQHTTCSPVRESSAGHGADLKISKGHALCLLRADYSTTTRGKESSRLLRGIYISEGGDSGLLRNSILPQQMDETRSLSYRTCAEGSHRPLPRRGSSDSKHGHYPLPGPLEEKGTSVSRRV